MVDVGGTFTLVRDTRDAHAYRQILRSGVTAVAVLDAVNLTGEYEVFEALNTWFRFPAYFGWNWDALFDCLVDLSWLRADRYVVVIDNAERLELALDITIGSLLIH